MAVGKRAHLLAALMMMTLLVLAVVVPASAAAQEEKPDPLDPNHPLLPPDQAPSSGAVPGQIIVKYEEGTSPTEEAAVRRQENLDKEEELGLIDAEVVEVEGRSTGVALRDLNRRPDVEYAELDRLYYPSGYTDEPRFGELWGLDNAGQTINGSPGTPDVDVNAREASATTQGDPNLVVAVIDTGVNFSHPDLADRKWVNPDEVPGNDQDDDHNGYIDDVNGWDFHYNDKTVHDPAEDAHGTHVAGTIAASANNQGIVGVAPNVRIMSLKFLGPRGGSTSNAIKALEYAKKEGARISNNSWGCSYEPQPSLCYSQALKDAIDASGQLFVTAAGNGGVNGVGDDNDATPAYPASYDSPNILSVAAINNQGNLASFSNYGAATVDISAPGVSILSSIPGIRDIPAVTLSSVGSSGGRAVTAGFGADEIGDSAKRASFFTRAFAAVGRGSQQVVLVDDDLSESGLPDVGSSLSTAIQSATGSAPEVVRVGEYQDADLSGISGKTVVWATGRASFSQRCFFCTNPIPNLTDQDRKTLTDFLNGGGKLVLTGMDVLYRIEGSPFVTGTLKLSVQGDLGSSINATTFSGSSGTDFAGESYAFNSSTAYAPWHDKVVPAASSSAAIQGIYPVNIPPSWQYFSGTSMAAPHATGVAALAASKHPCLLSHSTGLKQVVMDSGKPVSTTAGKTVTGDMVDAKAALLGEYACVTEVSPPEDAKGVADTTSVTATFLGEMNQSTLNASTFTLTRQGSTTPVEATVSYDAATRTATLDPNGNLENNTTYTATIKGGPDGAGDAAGNGLAADKVWTFSTVDTIAPTVIGVSPADQDLNAASDTSVEATFSEAMDPSTLNASTFTLGERGSSPVAATVSYNSATRKATLDPSSDLAWNRTYMATIEGGPGGAKDAAGNALQQDYIWTFSTANDTTAPSTAHTLSPEPNVAGWNNSNVTVTLNATDTGGSGTKDIRYSATGAQSIPETAYDPQNPPVINTEGTTTMSYFATDKAGNTEVPKTLTVKLDKTAPQVAPDDVVDNVWRNDSLSREFTASDSGSGLADNADANFTLTVSEDSANANQPTVATRTVFDAAGNSTTRKVSALIDKSIPTSSATARDSAGGSYTSGTWTPRNVTVSLSASDGSGAGVREITYSINDGADQSYNPTGKIPISSEGVSTISYFATDNTGNQESAKTFTVKIDKSAPTVDSLAPVGKGPTGTGWERDTNITATFSDEMDRSTLSAQTIKLVNTATGKRVRNVVVSYDEATKTVTLDPFGSTSTTLLAKNTRYKVTVTTGTKNLAGLSMSSPKSWTFTTGVR